MNSPPEDYYCPITGELMVDPVVDPDGHSYDKVAILKWLDTKKISPLTRNVLIASDLRPNLSLKNCIEAIRDQLTEDQLVLKSRIHNEDNVEFYASLKDIKTNTSLCNGKLLVNINMPNTDIRPPVDICLTIDISGSMATEATLKGDKGETINYGYSVLSVTVCAAKTIINCMNENDNISIVTYTDVSSILVDYWSVTTENKKLIEEMLDELKPLFTTNIWAGLNDSLDILRTKSPRNRMKGIFLLTDGVPNIEPSRGHEYMLEKYYKDNHDFDCMINCYGFGYSLKSELLQNISKISGGDGFAFIPDSSLLGNIFIHGISNFLTTASYGVMLNVTLKNGFTFNDGSTEKEIKISSLKYGQDKNIYIDCKFSDRSPHINGRVPYEIGKTKLIMNDICIESTFNNDKVDDNNIVNQECRMKSIETLEGCLKQMKFNEKDTVKVLITSFLEYAKGLDESEYIQNIIFDFEGRVKESLNMTNVGEKEDRYNKWGVHYLRSLTDAYKNEICNNFKDKGVSNFTGELFNTLRDKISDIFDDIPPPKTTIRPQTSRDSWSTAPTTPLPSMATYNTQYGGCCAKGSEIKMSDGTLKKVENLMVGDEVVTFKDNKYSTSNIECVIVTKCKNNKEFMVNLTGNNGNTLSITPYHPVYINKWYFPINLSKGKEIECEEMFTFVIDNRESVIIEDYIFATYNHQMKGEVIEHEYFGTEKVINDLKNFETYKYGYVNLTKDMFKRTNGKVSGIVKNYLVDYSPNYSANL